MMPAPRWGLSSGRRSWWASFVTGASAGLLAGFVLAQRRTDDGDAPADEGGAGPWERISRGLGEVWDNTVDGFDAVRSRVRRVPSGRTDLERLQARLDDVPGEHRVRIRDLGDGILEMVGSAPDADTAGVLLQTIRDEPGVRVVVNRVWTEESSDRA